MYSVDVYLRVRRAVMVEGMSVREASRVFGLHRDTVRKMLDYPTPPGYRRKVPPGRPKLEAFMSVIVRIIEEDHRVPKKQRHTARRIYERIRDEYGFDGQYTIVKDYVREHRRRTKEMFVPLSHPPGQEVRLGRRWRGHTCGVRTDGSLECWGRDHYDQATPPDGEFTSVSAGSTHTCGVRTDGTVACWGKKMPLITRPQVYRVVRELLPKAQFGPRELLEWLQEVQRRNERARRSYQKRRASLGRVASVVPP